MYLQKNRRLATEHSSRGRTAAFILSMCKGNSQAASLSEHWRKRGVNDQADAHPVGSCPSCPSVLPACILVVAGTENSLTMYHSMLVYISSSSPFLLLVSIGSSLTSIPGPILCVRRPLGKTCNQSAMRRVYTATLERALVCAQPSLKAASCANSSPNPSMRPFTKGNMRLIAAPLSKPQIVGGEYSIRGELEDDGGEGEDSLFAS